MSEIQSTWQPRGAWHGILGSSRRGHADGTPGVIVTPIEHLGIATVIASHGASGDIARSLDTRYGITLPTTPRAAHSVECTALWAGPEEWLVLSPDRNLANALTEALGNAAAVSDHSDARAVLRLSGPCVRNALSKGCPIDLDTRAFPVDTTAITAMALIGVQLWRLPDEEAIHLMLFRSMARSFWQWLSSSAAEFGLTVEERRR